MIVVSAVLYAHGKSFSPKVAEAQLARTIEGKKEEPHTSVVSRGGGGSLLVEYLWDCAQEPRFEEGVADLLPSSLEIFADPQFLPALRAAGAEEIILYVNVSWEGQCNMELSPSLLSALGDLGVVLAITCYEKDPDQANRKYGASGDERRRNPDPG